MDSALASSADRPFGIELSMAVFHRATRIARTLFAGGDSLIVLVQDGVAWRSRDFGVPLGARDWAAEIVMATGEVLWIEDARTDPRCVGDPLLLEPPFLRSCIAAPIRLEDGQIPGVLVVVHTEPQPFSHSKSARLQDVSDFVADEWARAKAAQSRRETERALDTAQARLSALVETMPISLVMTDRELRVVAASRTLRAAIGHADRPVVGRHLTDLAPDFELIRDQCERSLEGGAAVGAPMVMQREGGGAAWMQIQTTAWRDADGAVAGLVITASDISDLKAALDAAERSEDRLGLALALSEVHVWEIDYIRRELLKAGAEDSFFERPQTFWDLYRDIYVTIDERDREMVRESWRRHTEEGTPHHPQYRIARSDGKEIWVQSAIAYFEDENGQPLRLVGAIRNITETKHAEQRLIQAIAAAEAANNAKSQFLAIMSHEIRTPLNGVLGMAQAMAADDLEPAQRGRLEVVRESGESLLAILNDVLDISKIEAGKLELEEAEFDLGATAESVSHAFVALAQQKGVELGLEVTPAARGVYRGDATRVRQVLYNLISNAVKFTEAGQVRVAVSRRGGWVRLRVSDSGIGIAPENLQRLFEKFEQADASTTRRYGGSGLGLSICRELVQLMGGRIEVKSQPGRGATFTASLPMPRIADAVLGQRSLAPAALAKPLGAAADAPPLRVLAAEDNAINQLVLKTLLGQLGIEPTLVGDGEAALEAWEREAWDLVLMDVQMPRLDGPAATRAIRRREAELGRPRTPIVALTANAMSHQVGEYLAAGMDDFVAKPIEVAQLFAVLQRVTEPVAADLPERASA